MALVPLSGWPLPGDGEIGVAAARWRYCVAGLSQNAIAQHDRAGITQQDIVPGVAVDNVVAAVPRQDIIAVGTARGHNPVDRVQCRPMHDGLVHQR